MVGLTESWLSENAVDYESIIANYFCLTRHDQCPKSTFLPNSSQLKINNTAWDSPPIGAMTQFWKCVLFNFS
jgi:hypothetical protein